MASLPDNRMRDLLANARKYSSDRLAVEAASGVHKQPNLEQQHQANSRTIPIQVRDQQPPSSNTSRAKSVGMANSYNSMRQSASPRRVSTSPDHDLARKYSEGKLDQAGVNRRPSAAKVLTEDTDSFIIGDRVFVDGIKPGRIQYIGVTKFGPGSDWAGVFLDEALGKNDGAVGTTRYFTCEPRHGVFSKLHRLTREPIEGAAEALAQMRKYGYEVLDSGPTPGARKSSERESASPFNRRQSLTPDLPPSGGGRVRRDSASRYSPDSHSSGGSTGSGGGGQSSRKSSSHKANRAVPISINRKTDNPKAAVYANSPRTRSNLEMDVKIDKDPELFNLTAEARRLSMGGSARRTAEMSAGNEFSSGTSPAPPSSYNNNSLVPPPAPTGNNRGTSPFNRANSPLNRANSPINRAHSPMCPVSQQQNGGTHPPIFSRKTSESLGLPASGVRSRSGSESEHPGSRKASNELTSAELQARRLSEAGLRRPSVGNDAVLNDNTASLMVGQTVWVDGTKRGRIAYIGEVHFTKGEMAGVHLDAPLGKNNGTVGGILYFQCEPKRGVFSKLHRLAREPMVISDQPEDY